MKATGRLWSCTYCGGRCPVMASPGQRYTETTKGPRMLRTFDRVGPGSDPEQVTADLAADNLSRRLSRGDTGSEEGSRAFAEQRLAPAFKASELGHTMTWDAPSGITSIQTRWTCVECGRAVLQRTSMDHMYGSALDGVCTGPEAGR